MKILGICGSPKENGNSAFALRFALDRLRQKGFETAFVSLAGMAIHPCDGCFRCAKGECGFDDAMRPILEALRGCDGLILCSPVYMGMVSGQMKVMMDRSVALRVGGRFEMGGKPGAGIACGGFRNGGQELTLQNMQTFFLQQDMSVVADGPPYSHSGGGIVGKAADDEIGLKTVANLADRLARFLERRPQS